MINKQTTLDLNGPILSFTQQPSSTTINLGESATFVGIATASFPTQSPTNPATNTGSILYRWYVDGYGALSDGSIPSLGMSVTGTATTTLSISDAQSPNASGLRFYLLADYIPTAYSQPVGSAVTVGTARSTGNASNDPKSSDIVTLTVRPTISVTSNPSSVEVAEGDLATFTASGSASDGTTVSYKWQLNNSSLSDNGSTVFGSSTNTLRISRPTASSNTVRAEISHPTASNSPIYTSSANFNVVVPRAVINYEIYADATGAVSVGMARLGSFDLKNGSITFGYEEGQIKANSVTVYSPERDINVRIEIAAAAGGSYTFGDNVATGGGGGITIITYTLKKNVEYVFNIGAEFARGSGGLPGAQFIIGGRPNGGGLSAMYRGSQVLIVSGGGGGAGIFANGGNGGAAGQAGGRGDLGRYPLLFGSDIAGSLYPRVNPNLGFGGNAVSTGNLGTTGYFGRFSINNTDIFDDIYGIGFDIGGKLSSCIGKSSYWLNQGYSLCETVGFEFARQPSGGIITNTTDTIERGYKTTVLNYFSNGGWADENGNGGGGSGAYGGWGQGGTDNYSAGGGGSGYSNGEARVVSAISGGNNSEYGYATIQLA